RVVTISDFDPAVVADSGVLGDRSSRVAQRLPTILKWYLATRKVFMEKDRGLSPVSVEHRCHSVRPFLDRLLGEHRSLDMISVADIDSLLAQKVNEHHYARVSVRGYASSLRSFFRYAEMRGWCGGGIAASIMAPRAFQQETLPSGPAWEVVQEILEATSGDQPTMIRDHAILMI